MSEPIERLVAVGGGTQSSLWLQIVSDVTGRDQVVPAQTIGASYGDALLAAIAVGAADRTGAGWFATAEIVRPDARRQSIYDEIFPAYTQLYPAATNTMHTLAAFQERQGAAVDPMAT